MAKNPKQEEIQLPPVNIIAGGVTHGQSAENLAICQQAPGFPDVVMLLADAITKRAELVMLDFTQQAVSMKYQIDGVWHDLPPRDRGSGDAMLAVLKKLSNLNPDERRARQEGKFKVQFMHFQDELTLKSQGVQTGERVGLEIPGAEVELETLEQLGMREKMRKRAKELLNLDSGLIVVAALPKNGVSTLWNACLNTTDRYMRDFVSLEDEDKPEEEIINIEQCTYKASAGESPKTILPDLLLKEPDVFVVPEMKDAESFEIICDQVLEEERFAITRVPAKGAVDALLRLLALKVPTQKFAQSVKAVIYGRLTRKLCENCRQPYQPAPQLLQRLGIPAGRVQVLYREWQPPPQPMVDENGNPIETPICPQCAGIGYFGRTGVFELLEVTDELREAMVKQPQLDALTKIARAGGHRTLQDEGILSVCFGTTSLTEMQRVLKQ